MRFQIAVVQANTRYDNGGKMEWSAAVRRKFWERGVYLSLDTRDLADDRLQVRKPILVVADYLENEFMVPYSITHDDLMADDWEKAP